MNSNEPSENLPVSDSNPSPVVSRNDYAWLKTILAKNPFYIASAILLLYGIYRVAVDPKLFTEISQLLFNFSSFQFYEILLTVTAIVLVRRTILYDFPLLVSIECLFVFVPFILISHASLVGASMAGWFCLTGIFLAGARFSSLK